MCIRVASNCREVVWDYQVFCEDTPSGFVGIWPYYLKEAVADTTFQELLAVLRKWAILSDLHYQLYTSQNDYDTNDTAAHRA